MEFFKIDDFQEIDDFDRISDLMTALKLLKSWGKLPKPTNRDEAVRLLIDDWLANRRPPMPANQVLLDFCEQSKIRKGLADKSLESELFFESLPKKLKQSLLKAFPDFTETLRSKTEELVSGETFIIVAGEVGAGKSSLINLLLGEDLLPSNQLRCTNTICEIRNSVDGRKKAVAYLKSDSDGGNSVFEIMTKTMDLDNSKGIQELQECITAANEYDDSPYDKVKIYWPVKLGDGVVLVDTPGVDGGNNVDMSLQQYLSKAFGFIYVINTNAAGGVQKNRLGALLKAIVNAAENFSPETSLFIGNKWENIPQRDKKGVRDDIYRKLNEVYPGVAEDQIHCMSIIKSFKAVFHHKHKRREHRQMLEKVEELTYNSLRIAMQGHYTWLSSFLNKSLHFIRVANHREHLSKDELNEECKKLKDQISKLQKNTNASVSNLKDKIDYRIFKISEEITRLLPSRSVMDSLCNWTEDECVQSNKKWKIVAEEASCLISKRIQNAVDQWEKSNKVLKQIDDEIIDVFANEFGLMEHQVNELEASMCKRDNLFTTIKPITVGSVFRKKVNKIEKSYRTLGGAVSCVGGLDTTKKNVRKVFKDYKKDRPTAMATATVLFVETILQHKNLHGKLKKFFDMYFVEIESFAKRIPAFLQADNEMIETMSKRLQESLDVSQKYPELHEECKYNLSKLDTFFVNYIMKFDYQATDIVYDSVDSRIGSGAFADVYKGVLKDSEKEVAVKIAKDVVHLRNVTDVLMEDKIMRDLHHKNIVQYFGAAYKRKHDGIIWIMVMEFCRKSLKDFYYKSQEAKIPGSYPDGHPARTEAMKEMATFALQICDGLSYVHEKGYTHRDLKMENILLSFKNEIKLTDVGVAKPTNLLSDTLVGSPAYMAPEVLLSSGNQSNKVDIYSLSFILWEMWYGKDIGIMLNDELLGTGFGGDAMAKFMARQSERDGGFRPSFTLAHKPPQDLIEQLQRSWATDPEQRPAAEDLGKFFKTFVNNIK